MNVYVETNFVLELVYEQEFSVSCEALVTASQSRRINLVVPALALAESYWTLSKDNGNRRQLQEQLNSAVKQLKRTATHQQRLAKISDFNRLLVDSNQEAEQRFLLVREQLLGVADILPLTAEVLGLAPDIERRFGLKLLDTLQFAAILFRLQADANQQSCFLNRDGDFANSKDIEAELSHYNCQLISPFDAGWQYVSNALK